MALILTGQFTSEQAQPPEPDIHAKVVFQQVDVLQATGYVVLDGATPEIRLRANKFNDGVVQIGMLVNYGDEPGEDGRYRLPEVMERCIGKDLPDIPQMTSKFAEIVPRPHLQGNSVPIAAIR